MSIMPQQPFQWGAGGRRMTPEQIDQQRQIAASLMQTDYSPVSSPWQGLARVAGNVTGALQARRADKAQMANQAETQSVLASLQPSADGKPNIAALLAGAGNQFVDEGTRRLAASQYANATKVREPLAPHYWETNNGSLGMVGPDGTPQILYQDPTPKVDWITATNPDGTKTLTPMVQGQQGGMPQMPTAPVGKLTPIGGGQTSPASGTFR